MYPILYYRPIGQTTYYKPKPTPKNTNPCYFIQRFFYHHNKPVWFN